MLARCAGSRGSCLALRRRRPPSFTTQAGKGSKAAAEESSSTWTTQQKLGLAFFGSLVAGTAGLGAWQSTRYFWKVEQIQLRKESLTKEPLSGLALAGSLMEKNRRYKVKGRFLHDKELQVGPRTPPKSMGAQAQGLGVTPQGYYLITPLMQEDGSIVLVNRGWIPRSGGVDVSRPAGEVEVTGVVSDGEKAGTFTPVNDFPSRKLLWVDLDAIKEWLGPLTSSPSEVQAYLVQTSESGGEGGGGGRTWPLPRTVGDLQDFYVMPSTHLVYAITWFSLSAFGAVATRRILRTRPPH